MNGKRSAMTSIELMVVISVLVILAGLVVVGLGRLFDSGKVRQTRLAMETLQGMHSEMQSKTRDKFKLVLAAPLQAPTDITADGGGHPVLGRKGDAVQQTQDFIRWVLRVPENKRAWDAVNSDQKMVLADPKYMLPLDGWSNPIIYVPAEGLVIKNSGGAILRTVRSPDGGCFFASAGPDGSMQDNPNKSDSEILKRADDNIYSFEN